jgi:hypothetical protein
MVFSFKMAYIKAIEKFGELLLPIIIDSPNSSEISEENAKKMYELLSTDFINNQIIFSSMVNNIPNGNIILIESQLLGF